MASDDAAFDDFGDDPVPAPTDGMQPVLEDPASEEAVVEDAIREPGPMIENAERQAEELCAVSEDVALRVDEDDLLPSIGDRGEERRDFLRKQAEAVEEAAKVIEADAEELRKRAQEAQKAADEAKAALEPKAKGPRSGSKLWKRATVNMAMMSALRSTSKDSDAMRAARRASTGVMPKEASGGDAPSRMTSKTSGVSASAQAESEAGAEGDPAHLAELMEKAETLKNEAEEAQRVAFQIAEASGRATAAAEQIRAASDATEAEFKRRTDDAARKAALWSKTSQKPACAVIWLHGQGESEFSWQTTLADVTVPEEAGFCRWIWPRADLQHCSTRGGVLTPQWFDTPEFPKARVVRAVPDRCTQDEDAKDLARATRRVHAVIEALEAEGLPSSRIVLAGFGQGAALVAHAILRYQRPLAGGAMLSGWVPCVEALGFESDAASPPEGRQATDWLWCHGARDAVVEPGFASDQAKRLRDLGANVDFRIFPELAFGVNEEVVRVLERWLGEVLVPRPPPPEEGEEAKGEEEDGNGDQEAEAPVDEALAGENDRLFEEHLVEKSGEAERNGSDPLAESN